MRWFGLNLVLVALFVGGGALSPEAADIKPGFGAGLVDPDGAARAPWFVLTLQRDLGEHSVLEPELGFWTRKDSSPGVDNALSDASVGVNVLYRAFGKGRKARSRLLIGAGVGAHMVRSKTSVTGYDDVSQTELKQGLHLIVMAERQLAGGLRLFAAVRSDLVADLPQSKLCAGLRLGR